MPLGKQKIERRFPLSRNMNLEFEIKKNTLAELYRDFAVYLDKSLPDGRLKSLAMTKLEESHMFTEKAVNAEAESVENQNEE